MTLTSGTRLGPYEITAAIGAGGMGEVYKARDTRLDRTVAIKVLPDHLSQSAELRHRFEQEARAVSSLNHPHICTLHDVGQEGGIDFLVMEYLDGESLLDRLRKGPLPLSEALAYGVQIADALDKAHRQGVVHRDVKPGNIIITSSGGAKLLDFGLAKVRGGGPHGFVPKLVMDLEKESATAPAAADTGDVEHLPQIDLLSIVDEVNLLKEIEESARAHGQAQLNPRTEHRTDVRLRIRC